MWQRKEVDTGKNISVEEYLEKLETGKREIVSELRNIIFDAFPEAQEAIKWQVPCFSYKGNIAFINPAEERVSVGFMLGSEMAEKFPPLLGDGKVIRYLRFSSADEIQPDLLREILHEVAILNETRGGLNRL